MQLGLCFGGILHATALWETAHEIVDQGGELLEVTASAAL
jgi:hypothetical protein